MQLRPPSLNQPLALPPRPARPRGPAPTACNNCRVNKIKCRRPRADETGTVPLKCMACTAKAAPRKRSPAQRTASKRAPQVVTKALHTTDDPAAPIAVMETEKSTISPSSFPSFPSSLSPSFTSLASPSSFTIGSSSTSNPINGSRTTQRPAFSSSFRDTPHLPGSAYPSNASVSPRLAPQPNSAVPLSFYNDLSGIDISHSLYAPHRNNRPSSSSHSSSMPMPSLTHSTTSACTSSSSATHPPNTIHMSAYLASQPSDHRKGGSTSHTSTPASGYTFPPAPAFPCPRPPIKDDGRGLEEFPSSARRRQQVSNGTPGFAPPASGSTFPSYLSSSFAYSASSIPLHGFMQAPTGYGYCALSAVEQQGEKAKFSGWEGEADMRGG
ncbi:hypothetical protein JCM11251_001831 [Rhodosporidiobolus azoricus]